jgi:hypothetical protein
MPDTVDRAARETATASCVVDSRCRFGILSSAGGPEAGVETVSRPGVGAHFLSDLGVRTCGNPVLGVARVRIAQAAGMNCEPPIGVVTAPIHGASKSAYRCSVLDQRWREQRRVRLDRAYPVRPCGDGETVLTTDVAGKRVRGDLARAELPFGEIRVAFGACTEQNAVLPSCTFPGGM